jgi:uncharacterized repeat protein (TIGR01451 family)
MRRGFWIKTSLIVACILLAASTFAGQQTSAAQPSLPSAEFWSMAGPPLNFVTRTLQQGVAGYTGTEDTFINEWDPASSHGGEWHLSVRPGGVQVALFRFDVSGIPAAADVAMATLRVYGVSRSNDNPTRLTAWKVNRSWDANAATWTQATAADRWAQSGCKGVPADRGGTATAPADLGEPGTSCVLDVTAMVRDWVSNPGGNRGLLVGSLGGVSVRYQLASSSYPREGLRPALTIIYTLQPTATPTFTPTSTATPTHTPTVTATPTATPTRPPILGIEKEDSTDPVCTADMLRYNISVSNTGGSEARNLVVTDKVPLGAYFIEASPGGVYNDELGAVVWQLDKLAAGARKGVYIEVGLYEWIAMEGVITNAASVEADNASAVSDYEWTVVLLPTPRPLRYYYWPLMFNRGEHAH